MNKLTNNRAGEVALLATLLDKPHESADIAEGAFRNKSIKTNLTGATSYGFVIQAPRPPVETPRKTCTQSFTKPLASLSKSFSKEAPNRL